MYESRSKGRGDVRKEKRGIEKTWVMRREAQYENVQRQRNE